MLRLWPEQITVGLFPGQCWLRRHGQSSALPNLGQAGIGALAEAFDALLSDAAPLRGARLDLIVSDRAACVAALPWQSRLRSKSDWQAYARAVSETEGTVLDEGWVCVPAIRRYGEQGLAVALPLGWLAELEEVARRHGGKLRTVMPLSAAAYWSPRQWMAAKGHSWLLLEEREHVTLLCFDGRRSVAHDSQPAANANGLRQLLQRRLLTGEPVRAAAWSLTGKAHVDVLEASAPEVSARVLPADYWDRHA